MHKQGCQATAETCLLPVVAASTDKSVKCNKREITETVLQQKTGATNFVPADV